MCFRIISDQSERVLLIVQFAELDLTQRHSQKLKLTPACCLCSGVFCEDWEPVSVLSGVLRTEIDLVSLCTGEK